MEGREDPGDALVHLVRHQLNQGAPGVCHGLSHHIKQTYLLCRTSYSQATRPALVGSLEPVDASLGLQTRCEAEFWMGLESGHHPVDLSSPLQRGLRVIEVYGNIEKRTWVDT